MNITSWKQAQERINQLKQAIAEEERQLKEIESHTVEFVDNPKNIINQIRPIGNTDIIYVPTSADRKYYQMKKEDMDRHFDNTHLPIFFTDENSCQIFNSMFNIIKDLIKFKTTFDNDGNMKPSKANKLCYVYLDSESNTFMIGTTDKEILTTIYFSNYEIANNCAIWLNYKYGLGSYTK